MDSHFFQWGGIANSGRWIGVADSELYKNAAIFSPQTTSNVLSISI